MNNNFAVTNSLPSLTTYLNFKVKIKAFLSLLENTHKSLIYNFMQKDEKLHFIIHFWTKYGFLDLCASQSSHKGDTIQHQLQSMMVFYSVCKTCHQRQKKAAVVLVWQPLFCYCLVAL